MFYAWKIFRGGKTTKKDVMDFELHLEDNIFSLYEEVRNNTYRHSSYTHFQIFDNKKRDIYKAMVKDRIIHQIVYDYLLSIFKPIFISDSYASIQYKGQYKAINTFRYFIKLTRSTHKECYVLKCDVRKYFDNVNHDILFNLIKEKISCKKTLKIIKEVISRFHSSNVFNKGIPLGNITSQIFANIYLNSLDQYVKKGLKCRFYVRYNDDIVFVFQNSIDADNTRDKIITFVKEKLSLEIPINKTSIRKVSWGIDFLGFIILPEAVLLRDKTKQKIYANINRKNAHSYLSILNHCNSNNLKIKILSLEKIYEI